jgi:hypothetical protein
MRRDDGRETTVKENDSNGWSSDGVVLWLGRRQNGGWESDGSGRVACSGGADLMLQFRLEIECNGIKRCRKMKRRQRSYLGSMRRKCDMTRQHDDVNQRRGDTGDGKGMRRLQLGWHKSYWAKKWRKFMRSIQLVQKDGGDLNQWWVNLIF